jgi:hypothetical protein
LNTANITKATHFYDIQDAVSSSIPVDEKHEFYEDFSAFRTSFKERKIYRNLAINDKTKQCNPLKQSAKIFISGYRGTGKTSELYKLRNSIHRTQCYFTVFVDISDEELDTNNIETVDILILMLEKLLKSLEEQKAQVDESVLDSFYDWYSQRITEVNTSKSTEFNIATEASADTGKIIPFFNLTAKTKAQLKGSGETKTTIRRIFNHHFGDFTTKFNEFILMVKEKLKSSKNTYEDILFIIDGFEKIGSLADRKKILVDDSNKFTLIHTHMIITLPIELFTEKNRLNHFANTLHLPLIDLDLDNAKKSIKSFILKRVDRALFKDEETLDMIVKFGAGHPRQTLQIISRAYLEAEENILDTQSVKDAISRMGKEMSELNKEEMSILHTIQQSDYPPATDAYIGLKAKNILLEYTDEKTDVINPIVANYHLFKKRLDSLNVR